MAQSCSSADGESIGLPICCPGCYVFDNAMFGVNQAGKASIKFSRHLAMEKGFHVFNPLGPTSLRVKQLRIFPGRCGRRLSLPRAISQWLQSGAVEHQEPGE